MGFYTIGAGLYDTTYASITHNFRDKVNLRTRYGAETWVVLSGATNEIGKEFAKEFSKQGFNLVLVD